MREAFFELADALFGHRRDAEIVVLGASGESTTFVSFGGDGVRRAEAVERRLLSVRLVDGGRHASWDLVSSGHLGADLEATVHALERMRALLPSLPPDPVTQLISADGPSTEAIDDAPVLSPEPIVDDVLHTMGGDDVVGMLATGLLLAGFASSLGQTHWFQRPSFALDWSVHTAGRQATKHTVAGFEWDPAAPERRMRGLPGLEPALRRAPRRLAPGPHRAYLEPAAVRDLMELVSKDGFSARAWHARSGCLSRTLRGEPLAEAVTWRECAPRGPGPGFDPWGTVKPSEIVLFDRGRPVDPLVGPRSAMELGRTSTGAGYWEQPESLVMDPGQLGRDELLARLGTGVWISRLHYLTPTDFAAGRFSGLTRFATLWVEGGEFVQPIESTRLDESFLDVFGGKLAGLTREREVLLDTLTIDGRSTRSWCMPGALVDGLVLT